MDSNNQLFRPEIHVEGTNLPDIGKSLEESRRLENENRRHQYDLQFEKVCNKLDQILKQLDDIQKQLANR